MALSVNGGFGSKGGGSNPNLLDNGWFTVNQRGATSYSGGVYTVDRWSKTVEGIVTVNDGYISLTKGSYTYCNIMQAFENGLPVGTYTGSILFADGTMFTGTITLTEATTNVQYFFRELNDKFRMYYIPTSKYFVVACLDDSKPDIKAVKLERGTVSTLALDSAPNYTTELLKCQRYFVRLKPVDGALFGFGYANTTTSARISVPVPTTMRTKPTVSYKTESGTNWYKVYANGTQATVSAMSVVGESTAIVTLLVTTSNITSNHTAVLFCNNANSYIDLSADL